MSRPGDKYFKGRVIHEKRVLHYVIRDGVHNYENAPLQAIALAEKMPGLQLHVRVNEDAVADIHQIIAGPCQDCPTCLRKKTVGFETYEDRSLCISTIK